MYTFIGFIKKNSKSSKVLVQSGTGKYYVWEADNDRVDSKTFDGFIPSYELSLATPRQIEVGRGSLWAPNQSKVMEEFLFFGIVSGGKVNKTILLRSLAVPYEWFITTVPVGSLQGVRKQGSICVDFRKLSPARRDHIDAGLGRGKLRRKKRVSI